MIGVIIKTEKQANELTEEWIPDIIGVSNLDDAFTQVLGYSPTTEDFCHDKDGNLIYFTVDDLQEPRSIAFTCTVSGSEAAIITDLATILMAKIYDSESGEFIQL